VEGQLETIAQERAKHQPQLISRRRAFSLGVHVEAIHV
jgi:hypothetical protein